MLIGGKGGFGGAEVTRASVGQALFTLFLPLPVLSLYDFHKEGFFITFVYII